MRRFPSILLAASLAALAAAPARDVAACGGCFHEMQDMQGTQVSGHRMIFSVSATSSTLWDQISYVGSPDTFAWVLPVKGVADLELSSDALFENLGQLTQVTVNSPPYTCPPPPNCGGFGSTGTSSSSGSSGAGGGGGGPPVVVVSEKVAGPYEIVQLSSQDPMALQTWLLDHGYAIPPDISPIINAYVAEQFDFLAMKLKAGGDVKAMRPVRVTTPGGNVALPLRMVAAGTGAKVGIALWVFGEGRYQPANFPFFSVKESDVVWNWDTSKSNYDDLVQAGYTATMNKGWLLDVAEPFSMYPLTDSLTYLAMSDPVGSGYADDMGNGAVDACNADLAALFAGIPPASIWVSRMRGELSREALASDLTVSASADQTPINRYITAPTAVGNGPPCPMYPPCPDTTSSSSGSTTGMGGFFPGDGSGGNGEQPRAGSCAIGDAPGGDTEGNLALLAGLLVPLGMWVSRRRKAAR
ncbi:MAG: DUF2330 domain-containing protein [Byssovorax sp.]